MRRYRFLGSFSGLPILGCFGVVSVLSAFRSRKRQTDPNNAELHYWLVISLSSGTNMVHYIFFVKKVSTKILSRVNFMCQAKVIRIYNCPWFKLLGFSKCTF